MSNFKKYKSNWLLLTLFCVSIIMALTSCESVLDVRNEGQLSSEAALTDANGVRKALNGAYDAIQSTLGTGNPWSTTEALAGDVVYQGNDYGYLEIYNQNMSLFTPNNRNLWENAYRGINSVNNVLAVVDGIADMKDAEKTTIKAECHFIRGVLHFELLRMWSHQIGVDASKMQYGIVIRTEPTKGAASAMKQRSLASECYDFVIDELKQSESALSSGNGQGKATKEAAQAYLARVYFQKNDYANAQAYANTVLGGSTFSLETGVMDVFRKAFSKEAIFQIPVFTANNSFASLRGMYQKTRFGEPPFSMSPSMVSYIASLPSTDRRKAAFFKTEGSKTYNLKFDTTIQNVTVIRVPELLLIRAESALNNGGSEDQVRADINAIRTRAGAPAIDGTVTGKAALLKEIENERRLELCFEGDRFHYLRRIKSTDIRGLAWDSDRLLAKIPDNEISGNPSIILNP